MRGRICVARLAGLLLALAACVAETHAAADSLAAGFADVPVTSRPWCYWWWLNGHVDRETITADLESMLRLGFGGLLMFDSRGYWEDDDHLRMEPPAIEFAGPVWQDHVAFAVREAKRIGLEFTINISSSGGKLDGPWMVGADAPKQLMVCEMPLKAGVRVQLDRAPPELPNYHDVAVFAIRRDDVGRTRAWRPIPDDAQVRSVAACRDLTELAAWDVPAEGQWSLLRFGWQTMSGHERDVDMLDQRAVTRHWHRVMEPLKLRVGDLFGKTLTHVYSVSWEGTFPTWTTNFERDFRSLAGYELRSHLPCLAGFDVAATSVRSGMRDRQTVIRDFHRVRNEMFLTNFYGTVRSLAHAEGLKLYSESGGPWKRTPDRFLSADQLRFYAVNDMPQGEFWYREADRPSPLPGVRGAVSAAHAYGLRRASAEAFTHMMQHWSAVPGDLKRCGDDAFVDGVNHFVWHTFTCSPARFGVPGHEYFAGTHINQNVTWHRELGPFVTYLGRCQWMLQQGLPVVDLAVWAGDHPYQGWGRSRDRPHDRSSLTLPKASSYDIMDTEVLLTRTEARNGRLALSGGMTYSVLILDPADEADFTSAVSEKIRRLGHGGVRIVRRDGAATGMVLGLPDFEAREPFQAAHRRTADADIYFVTGEGRCDALFRVDRTAAEIWDPVTGVRRRMTAEPTADGRRKVSFSLPPSGSTFIVFRNQSALPVVVPEGCTRRLRIDGPWRARFSYHRGVCAKPPLERELPLGDFSKDADPEVAHFAGTVVYRTTFRLSAADGKACRLSLGEVVGGLVRVFVNGVGLGVVWTAPWEVSVPDGILHAGENEIEIHFVNAWANRLIADCALPPERRVTRSNLFYRKGVRVDGIPPECSGYVSEEPLFANGLIGPVECLFRRFRSDDPEIPSDARRDRRPH